LSQVREKFAEQNADALAVTILEESACKWTMLPCSIEVLLLLSM